LLFVALIVGVSGHGWMVSPGPRSAGGTINLGSGNAATTSPCGGGSGTPISLTVGAGDSVTLSYARANTHGNTGQTVNFYIQWLPTLTSTLAFPTPPSATTDILVQGATMDVSVSGPQSVQAKIPVGKSGYAAIQFHWMPTSGGDWWDCAFVNVLTDGVNATNNYCYNNGGVGDCFVSSGNPASMLSAICSPLPDPLALAHTCECRLGYYGDGKSSCTKAPPNVFVTLNVHQAKTLVSQDSYSANLALLMCIPAGRILYDSSQTTVTTNVTAINFEVTTGPNGESPVAAVLILRTAVATNDVARMALLPAPVVSVQATGIDSQAILLGAGLPAAPSATGSGGAASTAATTTVTSAATTAYMSAAAAFVVVAFAL